MKVLHILSVVFIMVSSIWCDFASIEKSYSQSIFFSQQVNTSFSDSILLISNKEDIMKNTKSPMKAMLYSAAIPGLGQTYMGKWKRGLVFLAIEGIALSMKHQNNNQAEDRKRSYKTYAGDNWDLANWIQGYYKWEPADVPDWYEGDQEAWELTRGVFINTDPDIGCGGSPHCYPDIWDHSHSVIFEWDGDFISSSNESVFKDIYKTLCGISSELDQSYEVQSRQCQVEDIEIIIEDINANNGRLITGHDYYEGIQKYPMYFAGWKDSDHSEISFTNNNNSLITSEYQSSYQDIWTNYNHFKTLAERAGSYVLINHFISMIDGLFLAKISNVNNSMKLNAYPDLKNRSGVGGIKFTFKLK